MLSPQLRSRVHNLWTMFWAAGMTNPLVAIEQITYLLFLRQLERLDEERVQQGKPSIYSNMRSGSLTGSELDTPVDYNQCRWSYIRQHVSFNLLNDVVFPWLRGLEKWLQYRAAEEEAAAKAKAAEAAGQSQTAASSQGNEPECVPDPLARITGRLADAYFVLDPNKTATLSTAIEDIDKLFSQLDSRSANADIMGDIFEHLLSEIQSAGKNGQFRTPRHIIRFMIELLDPPAGSRILDPACGTGGFLVNTLLHWRRKATAEENLRIEWDGTPHRCFGGNPEIEDNITDACFTGYDNDRTMVRIGWMNLILHGLEFPQIEQRDSLSKHMEKAADKDMRYDYILANPPFTGQVDEADLSTLVSRFPRAKGKFLTTKSELLFVWLMLDLLKVGGRCAVVVPDGVLFGGTNAHKKLRWELLSLNALEAVISLPAGVFLPYAGVKTSILVFRRDQPQDEKEDGKTLDPGADPRTREVWFYEVSDEAFTLDQKRRERFTGPNDLYDAQKKYPNRDTSSDYHQPEFWMERWRAVDADFLRVFPGQDMQKDQVLGIDEQFPDLPRDPKAAAEHIKDEEYIRLRELILGACAGPAAEKVKGKTPEERIEAALAEFGKLVKKLRGTLSRAAKSVLDREYEQHGYHALLEAFDHETQPVAEMFEIAIRDKQKLPAVKDVSDEDLQPILLSFARLDGYDIWLRSLDTAKADGKPAKDDDGKDTLTPTQLSWVTPVRAWAKFDDWGEPPKGKKKITKPTHGEDGTVLQEYLDYLQDNGVFDKEDGSVKPEYRDRLDPVCIEACDFNLATGRHKPFTFEAGKHRAPAELIGELQDIHAKIQKRLGRLREMVEGAE